LRPISRLTYINRRKEEVSARPAIFCRCSPCVGGKPPLLRSTAYGHGGKPAPAPLGPLSALGGRHMTTLPDGKAYGGLRRVPGSFHPGSSGRLYHRPHLVRAAGANTAALRPSYGGLRPHTRRADPLGAGRFTAGYGGYGGFPRGPAAHARPPAHARSWPANPPYRRMPPSLTYFNRDQLGWVGWKKRYPSSSEG
jgi:hypothetical protein